MAELRVRILQLGRRVVQHQAADGQTLEQALEATGMSAVLGMDLRINGQPAEMATELHDGDTVTIIPRIKGGYSSSAVAFRCRSIV